MSKSKNNDVETIKLTKISTQNPSEPRNKKIKRKEKEKTDSETPSDIEISDNKNNKK